MDHQPTVETVGYGNRRTLGKTSGDADFQPLTYPDIRLFQNVLLKGKNLPNGFWSTGGIVPEAVPKPLHKNKTYNSNQTKMKHLILKPVNFIFFLFFLLACSKDDIIQPGPPPPPPGNGGQPIIKGLFKFSLNPELSGQPYHSSNLTAVVNIANENNETIEKTLQLNISGAVTTETLELPVGNYRLTSLKMVYGGVYTHFAAPISGSVRSAQVQKPLSIDFTVHKQGIKEIAVEVLKVNTNDKPQDFGYPSGAFDNGQSDADPFIRVKLRAIMQIGDVLYDSIPASLVISTWNETGEMQTTYGSLKAGVNLVPVLKSAVRYEFRVSKWGTTDMMTLNRPDVDENTVYTLGGSREAKKLKSERVYRQVNGNDVPESKTDYFYDGAGKLLKIEYWLRRLDNSPYLSMTDEFEYQSGKVSKINRTDKTIQSLTGSTSFTYDNQGRITNMYHTESGKQTIADVSYHPSTQEVNIHYTYPGLSYDMNYFMSFSRGNLIMGSAATSHNNTELGRYDHDLNINPYRHMNWPNLFLTNSSKNNVTWQQKEYYGSYPVTDPYSFNYKYDAEGYPTELVKHFRTYITGNYAYSTKTVFIY